MLSALRGLSGNSARPSTRSLSWAISRIRIATTRATSRWAASRDRDSRVAGRARRMNRAVSRTILVRVRAAARARVAAREWAAVRVRAVRAAPARSAPAARAASPDPRTTRSLPSFVGVRSGGTFASRRSALLLPSSFPLERAETDSMREQQTQPGLDDLAPFFRRVGSAARRGLLLDFDGTIAPFAADRGLAAPYPGIRSRLRALVHGPRPTRVAI